MKTKEELKNFSKIELVNNTLESQNKIEELEKELIKYKNSNTPPSANKHIKGDLKLKNKTGKRGAPKGHKGKTRIQTPTETQVVDTNICPECGSHNLKDEQIFNRTIEEFEEPEPPKTKRVLIHKKKCKHCGHKFIPHHNTTPLKGKFGINIMVFVIFMKFLLRGVLRKSATFLETGFALKIVPASVNAIIKRVADACDIEYENLKSKIRNSSIVYVDETSFYVLNKKCWVWVFRTSTDMLLVIRDSRGSKVPKSILGENYCGTIICDCWRAYDCFKKAIIQRCWSHLLRKSRELKDTIIGKNFHNKLKNLFAQIKEFNMIEHTQEEREEKYIQMTDELRKIIKYYSRYDELKSVIGYINNNLGNWFSCVRVEGIEPTNNFAEQAIRETVVVRKIIGCFRSETGKENYERIASLISTWQLQEKDLKTELKKTLIKNLCFC
jgi:transposase